MSSNPAELMHKMCELKLAPPPLNLLNYNEVVYLLLWFATQEEPKCASLTPPL